MPVFSHATAAGAATSFYAMADTEEVKGEGKGGGGWSYTPSALRGKSCEIPPRTMKTPTARLTMRLNTIAVSTAR